MLKYFILLSLYTPEKVLNETLKSFQKLQSFEVFEPFNNMDEIRKDEEENNEEGTEILRVIKRSFQTTDKSMTRTIKIY